MHCPIPYDANEEEKEGLSRQEPLTLMVSDLDHFAQSLEMKKDKKKIMDKKNVFIGIYFFVFKHFLNDLKR